MPWILNESRLEFQSQDILDGDEINQNFLHSMIKIDGKLLFSLAILPVNAFVLLFE